MVSYLYKCWWTPYGSSTVKTLDISMLTGGFQGKLRNAKDGKWLGPLFVRYTNQQRHGTVFLQTTRSLGRKWRKGPEMTLWPSAMSRLPLSPEWGWLIPSGLFASRRAKRGRSMVHHTHQPKLCTTKNKLYMFFCCCFFCFVLFFLFCFLNPVF